MATKQMRVMLEENYEDELNALAVITLQLKRFNFDTQWRILNYVIARCLGRSWILGKPTNG